ncbi:MAG TPA: histidine kinase N-terminal 7TM domain-containing protein [Myxococcota bacterium]|jgi:PAS domain-containing protein
MWLHALMLELVLLLAAWIALGVWQRDHVTPGRRTFFGLNLAIVVWCLGEILELRGVVGPLNGDRIQVLGILALPPLWLAAAARVGELDLARRVPWFPAVLIAPHLAIYSLLWAGVWSSLFVSYGPDGTQMPGPLWLVSWAYSLVIATTGSIVFIWAGIKRRRVPHARWLVGVGAMGLVPVLGNAAWIAAGRTWPVDPSPLLLAFTLLALRSAVFSGGILQALPVSQHDLIEHLPFGVLLTDRRGTVIDVNPAAQRRLGISEKQALGRNLESVLAQADAALRFESAPVRSAGREAGQLVLLDPPRKSS